MAGPSRAVGFRVQDVAVNCIVSALQDFAQVTVAAFGAWARSAA